ncbi:MAG TPA: hypothetical protein VH594_11455 [Trebonia sp.]
MGDVRQDGRVQRALARGRRAAVDRIMRWRGRPRPTLPAAAIALAEPRAGWRRLRRTTFRWTK